jgi:3-phytase
MMTTDDQKTKRLHRAVAKTVVFTGALATLFNCAVQDKTDSKTQSKSSGTVLKLTHLKEGFKQTLYYQNNDQANAYKDTHASNTKTTALTKTPMPTASYKDTHAIDLQINEHKGISLTNSQGKTHFIKGSYVVAHAEVASSANKQWVSLVVFNNNTQQIEAYRISVDTMVVQQQLSEPAKGSEAICAAMGAQGHPHIINVDATGTLNQYELHHDRFLSLRSFSIGPGIKSCSVDLVSQSIYLADEFAGVWKVNANIESELEKTLIFHETDTPVEGVSVLPSTTLNSNSSLVGWVSPDKSGLWLQNQCHAEFVTLMRDEDGTAESIEPEFIHLATFENKEGPGITVVVDDDASGRVYSAALSADSAAVYFNDGCLAKKGGVAQSDKDIHIQHKVVKVLPSAQTQPVQNFGDAADDPAIWANSQSPSESRIIGTDKKGALVTYDLSGQQFQSLPIGRVNNVDVGYSVAVANVNTDSAEEFTDIAVASNRTHNSLSVLEIDSSGKLRHLGEIKTTLSDIYGMCLFVNKGIAHVFANDTSGRFERYELSINQGKAVEGKLSQTFSLPSQPEGCVVDTHTNTAYLGEEAAGIWVLDISSTDNTPTFISAITPPVEADIEGLALFTVDNKKYLIASSQGNNSYAIYHIHEESPKTLTLMGLVEIAADRTKQIDGVSETDGLEATNADLGGAFTEGLWVVQDGRNVMPSQNQNFKLVAGSALKDAIRELVEPQD